MYTMMHSVQWKNLPATQTFSEFYRIAPNALWLDKALALTGVWYECYLCPWEFLLLVYIYGTLPCRLIGYKSIASHTRHQARTTAYRTMQNGNCILYRYIYSLSRTSVVITSISSVLLGQVKDDETVRPQPVM